MRIALAACLLIASPIAGEAAAVGSTIIGTGNEKCSYAKLDDGQSLGHWTLGFWSGLKSRDPSMTESTEKASAIVGEVNKVCDAEPDLRISEAVLRVYVRHSKR